MRKKLKISRKNILLGGIIGLLLVAAVAVWVVLSLVKNKNDEPIPVESLQAEASTYFEKGDLEGGLKFFDEQLAAKGNEENKQKILLNKSHFARSLNDTEAALEAAEQANDIGKDFATMVALAELYEKQGDKNKALEYYQKVLDLSSENGGSQRGDSRWQQKIEELSS